MDGRQFLKSIRQIDGQIDSKLSQVMKLRDLAEKVTATLSSQPKGTTVGSRTEDCVLKIWDLERSINEDIDRLVEMKEKAITLINRIPDERYKMILEYRYLCGMTWEKISEKSSYDIHWLYVLHNESVKAFETAY
jgi:hypothetical protein